MGSVKRYGFEGIDADLDRPPLAAHRALQAAGFAVSIDAWRGLPLAAREALVSAGSRPEVAVDAVARLLGGAASRVDPAMDLPATAPPPELQSRLGPERSIPASLWAVLSPLDRYALARSEALDAAFVEIVGYAACSPHLRPPGGVRMVDVSGKAATHRCAIAASSVVMNEEALRRLLAADVPKGDVLGTARLAGIMAAKRTSDLVPLCHPIALSHVDLDLTVDAATRSVRIRAQVEAVDRTGVEMEAMVAASAAALTVYDMLKAFDRAMIVGPTQLMAKSGGRSGDYSAPTPGGG
jgi:cyclic pyranopterin phosphate synthase